MQTATFDAVLPEAMKGEGVLVEAFNGALPNDVRCVSIKPTTKAFAANECLWKRYVYRIDGDAATVRAACLKMSGNGALGTADADDGHPLRADEMQRAADRLLGEHDFASFQSKGGRSTTVRTLHRCEVTLDACGLAFKLEGDGFLYNMVRIIVGTLVQVGLGTRRVDEIADVLAAVDRARAGPTAPAAGLSLEHVEYERPWAAEAATTEAEA